jgi:hypothetical protein
MGSIPNRSVRLLASILICFIAMAVAVAANAQQEAIAATAIGETIQKVGFRAMIQKQAIMCNLAGECSQRPGRYGGCKAARRQGSNR